MLTILAAWADVAAILTILMFVAPRVVIGLLLAIFVALLLVVSTIFLPFVAIGAVLGSRR